MWYNYKFTVGTPIAHIVIGIWTIIGGFFLLAILFAFLNFFWETFWYKPFFISGFIISVFAICIFLGLRKQKIEKESKERLRLLEDAKIEDARLANEKERANWKYSNTDHITHDHHN